MPAGFSWSSWAWFARANLQAFLQVFWAYLLALLVSGLLGLSGYLPVVGGFMSRKLKIPLEVPVWSLFSVAIVVGVVVVFIAMKFRQLRAAAPPIEEAGPPPRKRKLEMFGLEWALTPKFFEFVDVESPGATTLRDSIRGPFCPQCSRLVQRLVRAGAGYGDEDIFYVEDPCGTCGRRVPDLVRRFPIHRLKLEVFKEAQRLHKRGELTT